jgi:integrase
MPKKAREVQPIELRGAGYSTPGLHAVGGVAGLYLQVLPTGTRSWILRAMVGAKRRDMGLGGFPDVPLADARAKARRARDLISQGTDPIEEAKAARSALIASQAKAVTFAQATDGYLKAHEAEWRNPKHAKQWRATIETYAYPVIGSLLVRDVQKEHVLSILQPIWATKTETASRLRQRIEKVLSYAMQAGYRPEGLNPARWKDNLDLLLGSRSKVSKPEHHAALPVDQVGAFMTRLREAGGMAARALEFCILTATRSGEVRGATWSEIDLDGATWTIPAARMKAGREHRIPLSPATVKLLQGIPGGQRGDLVFPAPRGGKLSDMTLNAVIRRMEVPAVPHGFRSTFRDWASERTNYPNEVCEMALAHAIGDKVEAAYRRGDLFEKRRAMMNDWAAFCAKSDAKANVIPLRGAKAKAGGTE